MIISILQNAHETKEFAFKEKSLIVVTIVQALASSIVLCGELIFLGYINEFFVEQSFYQSYLIPIYDAIFSYLMIYPVCLTPFLFLVVPAVREEIMTCGAEPSALSTRDEGMHCNNRCCAGQRDYFFKRDSDSDSELEAECEPGLAKVKTSIVQGVNDYRLQRILFGKYDKLEAKLLQEIGGAGKKEKKIALFSYLLLVSGIRQGRPRLGKKATTKDAEPFLGLVSVTNEHIELDPNK
ncbi:hypothetical protein WR25_18627 [Diploscapter pachys]|uniref:Uncharacterized protein n=1 Tax=Diploscapter pachys TaxID=2018661 RepID=A0A2A2LMZ3_9BILA|nr:hypothetical protein WR25_18627 [Diploscapter pachys]